ncbi:MAG: hypothetical protein HQK87_06250 [Nitrospinae bacterium]|nr:hypothetical protein [Nitrospinota bacterium]
MHYGIKTAFYAFFAAALTAAPAMADEAAPHEGHAAPMADPAAPDAHAGHGDAAPEGHGEGHGDHHAGLSAEIGAGVANGYERFGAIVTDQTVTKGFAGLSYNFGNGFHAGVHGLIASTSKEQFEREVAPHVGYHGDGFFVSAAYNSVNHTNHNLTTTEAQIGAGYQVAEHTTVDLLANLELDHEKRSFYEAGVAYARPLTGEIGLRFNGRFGYLRTDGIVASHDAGHTADAGDETTDTGHEPAADTHRSAASAAEAPVSGDDHATATGKSFAGLHRSSMEVALDYSPSALAGLKLTGFAKAIFPLSDDGKKDMEARSFDGKTSSITLVGAEVSFGF